MENQMDNVVQASNPSLWEFCLWNVSSNRPWEGFDLWIVQCILSVRVNKGYIPFSDEIIETDILANNPWELLGMDPTKNVGLYFWTREPKTENTERITRLIKNAGKFHWHQWGKPKPISDQNGIEWGKRRSFRHKKDYGRGSNSNTGWSMKEYVLDPGRVEYGSDNQIAFCIIYKNRFDGCQESFFYGLSDYFPQPNHTTPNAEASSSTLVVPLSPLSLHEFSESEIEDVFDYFGLFIS